ncbi:MAG: hypothetical protein CMN05_02745 [Roseibacillus sp.]|nr:hypothetical protein [Roseibacillus sp.]MBP35440.1 hypothetical protein [Roseibacillus sp.]MCP4728617.1 hypothetical protein [Roseibacillus sp.]MDP7132288.1 hypothetical protein [Planctomycetota bacterium]HJM65864.1 hypothetical protein [Roseibacillus sp.]
MTWATREKAKAMAPSEYAEPLNEIHVLGDIAMMFPGEKLEGDAKNMTVTNHEKANRHFFMKSIAGMR